MTFDEWWDWFWDDKTDTQDLELREAIAREAWEAATKAEREACAKACEDIRPSGGRAFDMRQHGAFDALTVAALVIRARSP